MKPLIVFSLLLFQFAFADNDSRITAPPDFIPPPSPSQPDFPPFKPTVTVISAVLIALFSITFLLLLYVKHCKRSTAAAANGGDYYYTHGGGGGPIEARKNSGIHRSVIETLPLFRFSSLRGEKNGLECAVCLNRFEPNEVLRLLPKCKHAFHVECVDTWLDAHSTCPLCRYRVDPEDVLLIDEYYSTTLFNATTTNNNNHEKPQQDDVVLELEAGLTSSPIIKRVLGRHSSAGERRTSFLTSSFRRSFGNLKRKSHSSNNNNNINNIVDRATRKDGLLLTTTTTNNNNNNNNININTIKSNVIGRSTNNQMGPSSVTMCDTSSTRSSSDRRLEHRINIIGRRGGVQVQRWSDVQPSDLLYLKPEKIISYQSRRFFSSNQRQLLKQQRQQHESGGINVINERTMSEITGLNRFKNSSHTNSNNNISSSNKEEEEEDERHAGVLSRWTAWITADVQPESTTGDSGVVGRASSMVCVV
ncbi:hypothetical protein ACFE04_000288 [Oxalis oulophora]